jgi:hypothetical protein
MQIGPISGKNLNEKDVLESDFSKKLQGLIAFDGRNHTDIDGLIKALSNVKNACKEDGCQFRGYSK